MKIAVLSDCYSPGINGVVTSISQQISVLRARGFQVDLYCPDYRGAEPEDGTYRLCARPFPFHKQEQLTFPWPPELLGKLLREPYQVFHLQTPFAVGLMGRLAAKLRGRPCVFHHHTLWEEYVDYLPLPKTLVSKASLALCRSLANSCHRVVAPSEEVKIRFRGQGVRAPISVIPTGIRIETFQGGDPRVELKGSERVCLYVGRLAHEKSLDVVLRVFAKVQRACPQACLWMVGDGPARSSLESLAQDLGIDCRFFGFVPRRELRDFVASAELFLFASQTETQGLVLLEAQAGGLPVVAVSGSGVNEAVKDGVTGFLVEPGEEELMAVKTLDILEEDSLRERFSTAAVEWSQSFSVEKMGAALESLYEKLVSDAGKPEK